jgi:phosphoglycerate kinase
LALEILRLAKEKGVQIHIPVDVIAADSFRIQPIQTVDVNEILMVGKVWTQVQNHWSSSKVIMDSKTILVERTIRRV